MGNLSPIDFSQLAFHNHTLEEGGENNGNMELHPEILIIKLFIPRHKRHLEILNSTVLVAEEFPPFRCHSMMK